AGLLFFLNPHLPFNPIPVLRGVGFFGLLLGGVSLILLLPFTWGRRGRSRRVLPWALTAVLAAAALGAWTHASQYAFFLPSGINRRLLKAAILLSLGALICFYTALVHRLQRRPYGRRSRLAFVLVALASVYVVMERREAFKPYLGPSPRATTFQGSPRPQLCVVGIDAATLDAILPLAEQGRLPFFSRMLQEGSHARLASLQPTQRIPLWTTLATGKYPFNHGIVNEQVFDASFLGNREVLSLLPVGVGFQYWGTWSAGRPIDSGARRALVLWEILSRLEIPSGLVGWPLAAPPPGGTPPEGVRVGLSEQFFETESSEEQAWPAEIAERARLFRTR
ncbi:MAG: alkaline phosphatase family protein, partial [bacterium]|nr:alkaline phosphatase family protein [bacterium]